MPNSVPLAEGNLDFDVVPVVRGSKPWEIALRAILGVIRGRFTRSGKTRRPQARNLCSVRIFCANQAGSRRSQFGGCG